MFKLLKMSTIYVLKCQRGKYYVGKTNDIERRISEHFSDIGSEWTKLYPPLEVIEKIDKCDPYDEDKYTLISMEKYGIDNVRGGSWSTISINPFEKESIQKRIYNAQDRCFRCGEKGHFVGKCPQILKIGQKVKIHNLVSHPEYNDVVGIIKEWSQKRMRWSVDLGSKNLYIKDINLRSEEPLIFFDPEKYVCLRCGRKNHYVNNCYARKDINGNEIPLKEFPPYHPGSLEIKFPPYHPGSLEIKFPESEN